MNLLNSASFNRMEQMLDVAVLRQKVSANNIANIDTPEFKRSDVRFEELLNQQMNQSSLAGKRTNPKHIPIGYQSTAVEPQVIQDQTSVMNNNLNNVDIDAEMSLLAKNQLRYNVIAQQVSHDIRNLKTAIGGR
ncbi:MAG: flagellar basal-body rod protein FlgB [Paenibacillaceae bacterium]|nr:flagellar basal-body rod protein FlgB [Paenibacillaceae bacterium]